MIMVPNDNPAHFRTIDDFAGDDVGKDHLTHIEINNIEDEIKPERRDQPRHLSVMRAARLSSNVHQVEGLGVVRNVSEGGMMIDAYRGFAIGEKIIVSLLDGDPVEGSVVWSDGSTIGVHFSSEIAIDHLLAKPRILANGTRVRPPRLKLDKKAIMRVAGNMEKIDVCDISQRGAKIRMGRSLAIDTHVQISMDHLRPISSSVKWQVEKLIGLEFHRVLTIEELSKWMATQAVI